MSDKTQEPEKILRPTNPDALILEAWGQGFMVGSLIIMAAITIANMKPNILLHKLIFAEVSTLPFEIKIKHNLNPMLTQKY